KNFNDIPFLVRKSLIDSGEVTGIADLAGRKLGVVSPNSLLNYMGDDILQQEGLTIDDMEMVILPFPDMVVAFESGAIDAAHLLYPFASQVIDEEITTVLVEPGDSIQINSIYFGPRLLDPANREMGVRFLMAYVKGLRDLYVNGMDEENAAIVNQYTEIPIPAIQQSPPPAVSPDGVLNEVSIEDQMLYFIERGTVEASEPIPLEKFIDHSFLEEALERLGKFEE
ncbi:MAG: ABC transporter substrate-binding protein, partial [Chloroflexota bacterium]|nr:ABC transporter substrate-binding protein [Chloroflexota bacterium]